jgi:hypothetical protein
MRESEVRNRKCLLTFHVNMCTVVVHIYLPRNSCQESNEKFKLTPKNKSQALQFLRIR